MRYTSRKPQTNITKAHTVGDFGAINPLMREICKTTFTHKKSHFRSTLRENCPERIMGNYVGPQYMQTRSYTMEIIDVAVNRI